MALYITSVSVAAEGGPETRRQGYKDTDVKFTRAPCVRPKWADPQSATPETPATTPASDSAEQNRLSWTRAKGSQFANRNEMGEEREEHTREMDSSFGLIYWQEKEHGRVQMVADRRRDRRPKEGALVEHFSIGSLFVWKSSDGFHPKSDHL